MRNQGRRWSTPPNLDCDPLWSNPMKLVDPAFNQHKEKKGQGLITKSDQISKAIAKQEVF